MGDLLDNGLVANTLGDEVPEANPTQENTEKGPPEKVEEEGAPASGDQPAQDGETAGATAVPKE